MTVVHQKFQVPKLEESSPSYKLYGCKAYVREFTPPPKTALFQVQETLHFRYLKCLVTVVAHVSDRIDLTPVSWFKSPLNGVKSPN